MQSVQYGTDKAPRPANLLIKAGDYWLVHCIAGSPALMSILPAKSKICWLFFQIEFFMMYGNQISIRDCRS